MTDLPATEHAIQFTGPGEVVHNAAKPVHRPGPHQLVVQMEAVGICFSDTKLLNAFTAHPRKSEVLDGLAPEILAQIPSYTPGDLPLVPGHECAGRIVAVGEAVTHHRVGERVLVQTDYRHLPTAGANAAFGYNFEGGLQEYVLLDERMILDPDTGERFLIPVGEDAVRIRRRPARALGLRRAVLRLGGARHPHPGRSPAGRGRARAGDPGPGHPRGGGAPGRGDRRAGG